MTPDDRAATPSYVGFKSCGCAVAAIVDTPGQKKEVSKAVADWLRHGLTVERKTVGWVRQNLHFCDCDNKAKPPQSDLPLPAPPKHQGG